MSRIAPPRRETVADVMTRTVVTVAPHASFKEASRLMERRKVSGLPVVDSVGRLVGVCSEADLLVKEATADPETATVRKPLPLERAKAESVLVRDLMSSPPITIRPDERLAAAAHVMCARGVKRLPVVDEFGALIGIVSRCDILSVFARDDNELHRELTTGVIPRWLGQWSSLHVTVEEGVVTIAGAVETRSDAKGLVYFIRGLDGVVGVRSHLIYRVDDSWPLPIRRIEL